VGDANLARLDRFWRTMKDEYARGLLLYRPVAALKRDLGRFARWYNSERPHWSRRGRAPADPRAPRPFRDDSARLQVGSFEGDPRLPVFRLRRSA
jgi:hypothetical protein